MKFTSLRHLGTPRESFKEFGLIFMAPPSNPKEEFGFWSGLGTLAGSLGKLAESATHIVDSVATLVESSVNLLDKGLRWTEVGIDNLYTYIISKDDPTDLPEYGLMNDTEIGKKKPTETAHPTLQDIIDLQTRMSFLNYKQFELAKLYLPVVQERIKVGKELDRRAEAEKLQKDELTDLNLKIRDIENSLNPKDPHVLSQLSDEHIRLLRLQLVGFKSRKKILMRNQSKVAKWPEPRLVKTVFPVGATPITYAYRFLPDSSNKVEVDLEELYYNVLPRHVIGKPDDPSSMTVGIPNLTSKIEEYTEETSRLAFKLYLAVKSLESSNPDEMKEGGAWHKLMSSHSVTIATNLAKAKNGIAAGMTNVTTPKHVISLVPSVQPNGSATLNRPPVSPVETVKGFKF